MILQRVGPQKWISAQVFMFGLVATFQMFMHNYGSFLGTRISSASQSAATSPGRCTSSRRSTRRPSSPAATRASSVGNILVSGVGGLMAAGILRLHDRLKPWQHLFLIEGCIALFCGIVFVLFLPDSPHRPHGMLSPAHALHCARAGDPHCAPRRRRRKKEDIHRNLTSQEIWGTLGNWRNYPHVLIAITGIATSAGLGQYTPT
jgi:MFS family permease